MLFSTHEVKGGISMIAAVRNMIERQDLPAVRCIIHVSCFRIKVYRKEVIGVGLLCEYSSSTVQKMRLGVDLPDGVIVFNKSHSTAFPTK